MSSPFKERVDAAATRRLADAIAIIDPSFDAPAFVTDASASLHDLELKARVDEIAAALDRHLAGPFDRAARTLCTAVSRAELDMWSAWPCTTYVERCGLDDLEPALDALACLTRYASAEFAIRPFLERYPSRTLTKLEAWAADDDVHLRRLVSEGTRPRLPWARRLDSGRWDPLTVLPLLDQLHDDPELYVRRSVANHVNDLTKNHPELALMVIRRWLAAGGTHVTWVARHALRGLIKAGDPDALVIVGANPLAAVEVGDLNLAETRIRLGEALHFSFTVRNPTDDAVRLEIDYVVHHRRANGSLVPKVFKLSTRTLAPRSSTLVRRAHPFRPIATRRYYAGDLQLEIKINGRIAAGASFVLDI